MSTRNERRLEKKKIQQKLRNPTVRRLVRNELETGKGSEIYRLDDDGTGKPIFFDVYSMRAWAEQNLEVCMMPPDFDRAMRLLESGAIDPAHIKNHTLKQKPSPLIVCRDAAGPGEDQIVDGAHRFVALCGAMTKFGQMTPIPTYVLQPAEWRSFVIPSDVAEQINLAAP